MTCYQYLRPSAIKKIQDEILKAKGNEVFFVGTLDAQNCVGDVHPYARGHRTGVPIVPSVIPPSSVVIHNHPSGILTPSEADVQVAAGLANQSVGFYIVNNDVSDIYVVVEPLVPKESVPVSRKDLETCFHPDGLIAKEIPTYEYRESQIQMAQVVADNLQHEGLCLVEAGTGTGKSFAYLIPLILWAKHNNERVVISTNTIQLQEQLLDKDLPLLRRCLSEEFKAVLVKGRGNYLCLWKLDQVKQHLQEYLEDADGEEMLRIFEWAAATHDGSLSDLNFVPSDGTWTQVNCEGDMCPKTKCCFFRECHLMKARRKAASAEILIVNHHLLFADLSLRSQLDNFDDVAILPAYHRILLDEVHNIEDVGTRYFSHRLSWPGLKRVLNKFYRLNKKGEAQGLFASPLQGVVAILGNKGEQDDYGTKLEALTQQIQVLGHAAEDFYHGIANDVLTHLQQHHHGHHDHVRLTEPLWRSQQWQDVFLPAWHVLIQNMDRFLHALEAFYQDMREKEGIEEDAGDVLLMYRAHTRRLERLRDAMLLFASQHLQDAYVRWMEHRRTSEASFLQCHVAPLHIGPMMQAALFRPFKSVGMTSATLTVDRTFDFVRSRLGMTTFQEKPYREKIFPPIFDYETKVALVIPTDMPDVTHPDFVAMGQSFIMKMSMQTQGRSFVLFTSYRMLDQFYKHLSEAYEGHATRVLRQGEMPRSKLLQRFRDDQPAILLGTNSFWEGVDIVGENLQSIIIMRLPFAVPTDPVVQARLDKIKEDNQDPFYMYSVPQAVIKFRQGFGRLIRSQQDYGIVSILDKRVLTKSYGKSFIASLPPCHYLIGRCDEIHTQSAEFLSRHQTVNA